MDGWVYVAGANAAMNAVIIVAVKMIVGSAVKRFEKQTDTLWDAINKHGHKGLDGNDAKVTR